MSLEDLLSLTSKDRILLYLSDFSDMADRYELPADLTQESIAFGTGIQRKHLSQYLKDLMKDDLVVERKAHIKGMKQRMNGYYLTPFGFTTANTMRDKVGSARVSVLVDEEMKDMMVSDIDDATSVHITLCDIVREAIRNKELRMSDLESVETRKRVEIEVKEQDTDVYKRALQTAWKDGRVTATERFLVEELRKHLNITDEQHRVLEDQIIRKLAQDHMEFRRIYIKVLEVALADRMISGPEVAILEELRRVMRISRQEHDELVKDVEISICGPPGCQKDLLEEAMRLVRNDAG
jgi:DNA-binding HxlR family transcriptional regulator